MTNSVHIICRFWSPSRGSALAGALVTFATRCIVLLGLSGSTAVCAEELTSRTLAFDAGALRFEDLRADLVVKVGHDQKITLTLFGSKEQIDAVSTDMEDETLVVGHGKGSGTTVGDVSVISLGQSDGTSRSAVTINGDTVVTEGGGVVVISGQTTGEKLRVEAAVPLGTSLSLTNFKDEATIGDVRGPLTLDTSGKVQVGEVTRTDVQVRGSGDVRFAYVIGQLDLEVRGNGDLTVAAGNVHVLSARVKNNGKATYLGRATQAQLFATGNGELAVATVVEPPIIHVSRNGEINVGNW